ncbi:MAG: hypothetical protein MUC94_18755 [bacterium]|nr:hypothetical protein [bacterium]
MLAIIVGTVIGSGVFITLPIVARETGSPMLAVFAWLIGGLIWIPQIFILAELGTAYPEEKPAASHWLFCMSGPCFGRAIRPRLRLLR